MGCESYDEIAPLKVGETKFENELLLFIKPEIFMLGDKKKIRKAVTLILDTIGKFGASVDGIYAVSGKTLEEYNIMSKHYGYIDVVSHTASKKVDQESRKKIAEIYGLEEGKLRILGGHEYLALHKNETPEGLDRIWFAEKSVKIRSGFYVRHIKSGSDDIILVNGFHPSMLAHFTTPSHKIVLMLLHSDTEWATLKNEMVGATFPEKADPNSIRGILYREAKEYGFQSVSIANNCVHLSAGPFEGMFEVVNFFSNIAKMDLKEQKPLLLKELVAAGVSYEDAVKALDNPKLENAGKPTDLFSATENMDTEDAVNFYKNSLRHGSK